jgi:hypothetical protein
MADDEAIQDFSLSTPRPVADKTIMKLLGHWGKEASQFGTFFKEHCNAFDADCMVAEQKLEYHDIFEEYQQLYEAMLSRFLATIDCSESDFLGRCRQALEEGKKSMDAHILRSVLAGTDYEAFVRMMADYKAMQPAMKAQEKAGCPSADEKDGSDEKSQSAAERKEQKGGDEDKGAK